MIKYRVICAFVFVWLAVCLSYVGVRTALSAVLGSYASLREQTEVEDDARSTVATEAEVGETETVTDEQDARVETEAVTGSEMLEGPVGQTDAGLSDDFDGTGSDVFADDDGGWVEDEGQAQEGDAPDIPSLSEYLGAYSCGSCRHRCSLANPRCHNGSRLAEQKAQEYYELYGQGGSSTV